MKKTTLYISEYASVRIMERGPLGFYAHVKRHKGPFNGEGRWIEVQDDFGDLYYAKTHEEVLYYIDRLYEAAEDSVWKPGKKRAGRY